MVESELIDLISSVGFPIVVTTWFMFRVEKIISKNTEVMMLLKDMIEDLCKRGKIYK